VANFDSGGHQRFVMDAPTFAARPSTNPCLIDLDMLAQTTADPILIGAHHAGTQLVQNAESGLKSRQPKLPLKLYRRHARSLTGDEVGGPEPDTERRYGCAP